MRRISGCLPGMTLTELPVCILLLKPSLTTVDLTSRPSKTKCTRWSRSQGPTARASIDGSGEDLSTGRARETFGFGPSSALQSKAAKVGPGAGGAIFAPGSTDTEEDGPDTLVRWK